MHRVVPLAEAEAVYACGLGQAVGRFRRDRALLDELQRQRRAVAGSYLSPGSALAAHVASVARQSEAALGTACDPTIAGLAERDGRTIATPALGPLRGLEVGRDPIDWITEGPGRIDGVDWNQVREAIERGATGSALPRLSIRAGGLAIHAPTERTFGAVAALAHEIGHFLYESSDLVARPGTLRFYLESELSAFVFAREAVRQSLPSTLHGAWSSYCAAEDHLACHFLQREAAQMGLPVAGREPLDEEFLWPSWLCSVGYQVVYGATALLASLGTEQVLTRLLTGRAARLLDPDPQLGDARRLLIDP